MLVRISNAKYRNVLYQQLRFIGQNKNPEPRLTRNSFRVERDGSGQVIRKKQEKGLGAFRPLPAQQLQHQVFGVDRPNTLALPTFSPEIVTKDMIGKAAAFSLTDNDPVRIFGLPKKMLLEFRILSAPCSVIRDVTLETVGLMQNARDKPSRDTRAVLTGRSGCGKSFLMLQTVEHCIADGWIVIYIPRAVNLVNSTTSYEYDLRTRTYVQPTFSYQTLQRLQTVNRNSLLGLTTSKKLIFEKREVPNGSTLFDLIGVALKDPSLAPVILDALMLELSAQTKHPVLLAVDDFQALFCRTAYRDPHFTRIQSNHLSIPRLILDFASGKRAFERGAFLGALTASCTNFPIPLGLREALGIPSFSPISPYDKGRSRVLQGYTKGLKAIRVPEQLSVPEAAALFEVWMKDQALLPTTYDETFLAKYTESSGNARDFVWKGLLATMGS